MSRLSKQARDRAISPRKRRLVKSIKTGSIPSFPPEGYKHKENTVPGNLQHIVFIPQKNVSRG